MMLVARKLHFFTSKFKVEIDNYKILKKLAQ